MILNSYFNGGLNRVNPTLQRVFTVDLRIAYQRERLTVKLKLLT